MAPQRLQEIERALDAGTAAKYYMSHHVTKHWTIPRGRTTYRIENLLHTVKIDFFRLIYIIFYFPIIFVYFILFLQNFLPSSVLVGLMDSDSFNGDKTKSNFLFANNGLTELRFVSGESIFPSEPFRPDFANDDYSREFVSLFCASGHPAVGYELRLIRYNIDMSLFESIRVNSSQLESTRVNLTQLE